MLHNLFEFCGDSIAGRDKVGDADFYLGGSNQDHRDQILSEDFCVLTVTDGCTGSDNQGMFKSCNQLGAISGASFVIEAILAQNPTSVQLQEDSFWNAVHTDIVQRIKQHADSLIGTRMQFLSEDYWNAYIQSHFMFTIVGVCMTKDQGRFFSIGDGYVSHNNQLMRLGSELSNPAYIGRCLMKPEPPHPTIDGAFKLSPVFQVATTQNFGIYTDGLTHLLERGTRYIPGTDEILAPISRLWTTDRFFEEPSDLTCWLRSLGNEVRHKNPPAGRTRVEQGLIRDDFAFTTARRKDSTPCTIESTSEEKS